MTAREREILELAGSGLTNWEIARRLDLAEASVKGVIARLMRRYGCHNRIQLISRTGGDEP